MPEVKTLFQTVIVIISIFTRTTYTVLFLFAFFPQGFFFYYVKSHSTNILRVLSSRSKILRNAVLVRAPVGEEFSNIVWDRWQRGIWVGYLLVFSGSLILKSQQWLGDSFHPKRIWLIFMQFLKNWNQFLTRKYIADKISKIYFDILISDNFNF